MVKVADLLSDEALAADKEAKAEADKTEEKDKASPSPKEEEEKGTSDEEGEEEEEEESSEGSEEEEEEEQAEAESPPPALTDQEKLALLATDPALRQLVEKEAQRRVQAERTAAETRAAAERRQKLIDDEDYETLGKEYVDALKKGETNVALKEAASQTLFGDVLPAAVSDPASQAAIKALTQQEAWDLHPDNPINSRLTDPQYFAKFIQTVATKREFLARTAATEKKAKAKEKAAKNEGDAKRLRGAGADVPGGKAGTSVQGSARDLIGSYFEEEDQKHG